MIRTLAFATIYAATALSFAARAQGVSETTEDATTDTAAVETIQSEPDAANADEAVIEALAAEPSAEPAETVEVASETDVAEVEAPRPEFDFLLMEPQAEVVFITTGGSEIRADWTETATMNLKTSFRSQIEQQGHTVVEYDTEGETSEELEQLMLLYDVVAASSHVYMPHKKGKRPRNNTDLTLGENAALLKEMYNTDQAVFVDHYSSITSSGVFWTSVMVGAVTGYVPVVPTVRSTSGHVVDLETGDLVASNVAMLGDAREATEAESIVSRVMKNLTLE